MTMFGADVEAIAALATQLDLAAVQLASTRHRVGATVQQAKWIGPVAERFRSEWNSTNSARLAAAAQLLDEAASILRRNAAEQSRASSVSNGGSETAPAATVSPTPISSQIAQSQGITAPALLSEEQKLLDQNIPGLPWSYNQIGGLIPHAADALDVADLANSIAHGNVSFSQVLDLTAGAARGSGDPYAYVAGVAVGMGNTIWEEAQAANINLPQVQTDISYIQQNPLDALQAAGQAIATQFPREIPDLLKNLIP